MGSTDEILMYTKGDLENAKRRALNLLDSWLNVTGIVEKRSGYYAELQGVIEDALECGAQSALGVFEALDSEKDSDLEDAMYR